VILSFTRWGETTRTAVRNVEHARSVYEAARDDSGAGASDLSAGSVREDVTGVLVARIAYNGRVTPVAPFVRPANRWNLED
jgi:hypothetical protein